MPEEDETTLVLDGPEGGPGDVVAASVPSPMADLPVGATFGSLVHAVLEHADPGRLRTSGPSCCATSTSSWCGGRSTWTPRPSPTPWSPCATARSAPWPATGPCCPWASPTACASSTSRSRCPGATTRPTPSTTSGWATSPRSCAATCPTVMPVRIYADALDRDPDLAAQPLLGYLTGSIDVVLRLDVERPGALPHRRLQDQLARHVRRAADRPRLPPGDARRGDGALRLPAPGAALHRRAAPVPALAAPRLRPRHASRRRPLPLPPRHVRSRHASRRRAPLRDLLLAPARWPSSRSSPTCSTAGW